MKKLFVEPELEVITLRAMENITDEVDLGDDITGSESVEDWG